MIVDTSLLCYSYDNINVYRKLLVNDTPTIEDLEGIDYQAVKSLKDYREIEKKGITSETFSDVFEDTFTTQSSDERIVEIIPGGAGIPLTFENRHDYCDKIIQVSAILSVNIFNGNLYIILLL